jgi:hypothetical protein
MHIMKKMDVLCIIFLCLSLPVLLPAEEQVFLDYMQRELENNGWSLEEIAAFKESARHYTWEKLEGEFCEMIAHSLLFCRITGKKLSADEEAALAFHLALMATEMIKIGFREQHIIRISFHTSRDFASRIDTIRKEGDEAVAEMIRERIRLQLCKEGIDGQLKNLMKKLQKGKDEKRMYRYGGIQSGRPHHGP